MTRDTWTNVDRYHERLVVRPDEALDDALASGDAAGMPAIAVAPNQGKLLMLLAQIAGATRVLEIGTLAGYSTIWMARGLVPGGRIVTLEVDPHHAAVARANFERAGVASLIDVREGRALDTLPALAHEKAGPFDLIFIDADKQSIPEYFDWAVKLSRPGSVIIVDNVVRDGKVIDPATGDANIDGVRRFNEILAHDRHVVATTIQTVGSKGYDGFTLARVVTT
ncbi:MAG TPA: O-methyltransferase [Gemmatimonadales bacterium]|jgi:predicted O-methyltransferase YrrM